jgi:hypothetical protein
LLLLQALGQGSVSLVAFSLAADSRRHSDSSEGIYFGGSHFGTYSGVKHDEAIAAFDSMLSKNAGVAWIIALGAWAGAALVLASRLPYRQIWRARQRGYIVDAPNRVAARVRALLGQILAASKSRLGTQESEDALRQLKVLIARQDARCTPSVLRIAGESIFVIPAGMLKAMYEPANAPAITAMLAHEIGHVVHDDADVWASATLARILAVASIAGAAAAVAFNPRMLFDPFGLFLLVAFVVPAMRLSQQASLIRQGSELLADRFAVLTGHGQGLADAIQKYVADKAPMLGRIHPAVPDRLRAIENRR